MRFGSGIGITRSSRGVLSFIKDNLKLYMPYKGADTNKGVQFVGTGSTLFADGDYIEVADDETLNLGTSDFTVCAWVNLSTSDPDGYAIVWKEETTGTDTGFGIRYYEDDIKIDFGDNSSDLSSYLPSFTAVSLNVWHYLSFVFDRTAGTVQGYLDGVIKGTTLDISGVSGSIDTSTALFIGKDAGSYNYMNGSMKNVAIWNRKITATEIQNVMYKQYDEIPTSSRLTDGLVSWWALDDADVSLKNTGSSVTTYLYRSINSLLTEDETYKILYEIEPTSGVSANLLVGDGLYSSDIHNSGWVTSNTLAEFTFTNTGIVDVNVTFGQSGGARTASLKKLEILDSSNNLVWNDFTAIGDWTEGTNATVSNIYIDNHGTNHGTSGDGSTSSTFPTHTYERYGQQSPVIPRAIDNAPTVQADAIGSGSALFVASNTDYINVGNSSSLQITGTAITVTSWVNILTDTDWMKIISNSTGGSYTDGYTFFYSNEQFHFSINHETTNVAKVAYTTYGEWHHLTGVYDGTNIKIYVDGVLGGTDTYSSAIGNTRDTYIGAGYTDSINGHMNGNICQLGIWAGALTQEEIQSVMEKTFEELDAEDKGRDGDEVNTTANATSPTNETNATTGWADLTTDVGLTTDSTIVDESTYSLKFVTGTSQEGAKVNWTVDNTSFYRIRMRYRAEEVHTTGFKILLGTSSGGSQYSANEYDTVAGVWDTITEYVTTTGTTLHMAIEEKDMSSNILTMYIDNISVKKMNDGHDLVSYWSLDETIETGADLVYDKASETLGDNLITNGDFSSALGAEWDLTLGGGGGSIALSSEGLLITQGGSSVSMFASQDFTTVVGKTYLFSIDLVSASGTTWIKLLVGTSQNGSQVRDSGYSYVSIGTTNYLSFTATATTTWISIQEAQTGLASSLWDNISVKEVGGNAGRLI